MRNWFGAWLLIASACLWVPGRLSAQTGPQLQQGQYVIEDIEVTGAVYTDVQTVVLLSGLSVGQSIEWPSDIFSKTVQRLWKQEIFSDIEVVVSRVVGNKLYLTIRVGERPRLTNYRFSGISRTQADELSEKIAFVRGTIFTESKRRAADRIIRNYYQEKGYLDVGVKISTDFDTLIGSNGVSVLLRVQKGPRVKISHIEVAGNDVVADKRVRKQLKNTKRRVPGRFWKKSKFIRGDFAEDKDKLVAYYQSKGYRDAEVVEDSISRVPAGRRLFGLLPPQSDYKLGRINLYLKVYEGPQYFFGDVRFTGNQKYDSATLLKVLDIQRGEVYDREKLDRKLSLDPNGLDVSSLYLDDGYLFFNASPVEVLGQGDTINLEIRVYEGPQATINKIILQGNETTSDHVILRELRTLPGEKFSRSLLIRSQREILNLGFFDQEAMDIVPLPNPQNGTVDIKYVIPERSNDQITLQGGYGGVIRDNQGRRISGGLVATVGLQFNNFSTRKIFEKGAWRPIPRGQGQKLSLSVQTNGPNFQNYAISFLEPWFGGRKPNSLGFSFNFSQQRSPLTDYRFNILGGSIDLGRRLKWPDDFFRSYTTLSYRNYQFRNANIFGNLTEGNINILSVRQTFDRSSIDAPIFSRSGAQVTLSAEATPPWSLISGKDFTNATDSEKFELLEFYKIKFDTQLFLSLTSGKKPLVLAPRVRFGFLGAYDPVLGVSPFERFYLGGDGLQGFNIDGREIIQLRGYEEPILGPLDGGTSFAKYTIELRQPITLEQQSMIWVHGYVEAGRAWDSIDNFNPFVVYRSAGLGLRAFLPMFGLLGLDWGYGFDTVRRNAGSPSVGGGQLHFIIGQQF
ncbi:MAG: outer membrane protein assembly factor BamA [Bacteroidia bacterium]|nr:outer membrane protein assembly factor BamA [Bacteroidia bacterium]